MQNAYYIPEFVNEQPSFTTKTDDFEGWIDHIWISNRIEVQSVLTPPVKKGNEEEKTKIFRPIPNINFPSDHIPLGVVIKVN